MTRFPIEPLEAAVGFANDQQTWEAEQIHGQPSATRIAEIVGVASATVSRWRTAGIPERNADRAAIAVGLHPLDLWPNFHTHT